MHGPYSIRFTRRSRYSENREIETKGAARYALVPYLPLALQTRLEDNGLTAAAVLALLDADWSRRELLSFLEESSDQDAAM